jgi:putative DNA primase/helicase
MTMGKPKPDGIVSTEDSVALEFERINGDRFKFNATRGHWLVWNRQTWADDETGRLPDSIRCHCRETAMPTMHKHASVRGIEALSRTARRFACVQRDFDRDPFLLGTPGGTVDLKTGILSAADPSDMITRSTSVAPAKGAPTRWLQFLAEATGNDASVIRYLQQVAGYALTGDTREHALFFVFGDGGTGKSTFLNTLQRIFGSYARTAPMDAFAETTYDKHPTDLAMLAGARLVAANETEQGRKWAAARIKSLTGGDPIAARFMRQDFFEFTPEFKLLFVGNFAPSFETVDDAIRRRFYVLPFDIKPKVKDDRLTEKLTAEGPQILQWCIDGCRDWLTNGLVVPEKVRQATDIYFSEQDMFARWLEDRVHRCDHRITTPKSKALASWNAFRKEAGDRPEKAQDLNQRLSRAGFHEGRSPDRAHRERVWHGMGLHHDV